MEQVNAHLRSVLHLKRIGVGTQMFLFGVLIIEAGLKFRLIKVNMNKMIRIKNTGCSFRWNRPYFLLD